MTVAARLFLQVLIATLAVASALSIAECGTRHTLFPRPNVAQHFALSGPPLAQALAVLVLLPGGPGVLGLTPGGCASQLSGNFLLRSREMFHDHGLTTVVLDAPDDFFGPDGLGGHRITEGHANEIGDLIAHLKRLGARTVWLLGHSRGALSAANAAARLAPAQAPDGLILTSPVTVGGQSRAKPWVAQTIDDVPVAQIRLPMLMLGHADDPCPRSPAEGINRIRARMSMARRHVLITHGGPDPGLIGIDACAGRSRHGFLGGEREVVAAIAAFVRGNDALPARLIFPGPP